MGSSFGNPDPADPVQPCPLQAGHWLEIRLVDGDGDAIAYEEYLVTLPDGSTAGGYLDEDGWARFAPIQEAGTCQVSFPRLDSPAWKYDHAQGPGAT